jgi:hypothetical protein
MTPRTAAYLHVSATMNQSVWVCSVCQGHNGPHLTSCNYCRVPRGGSRNDAPLEVAPYIFSVPAALFCFAASIHSRAGLSAVLASILVGWWCGLICVAMRPAWGFFIFERSAVENLLRDTHSQIARFCIAGVFRFLYWPIFIPKTVYVVLVCLFALTFYVLKGRFGL